MSHAGDGNFHLMLILDPADAAEMDRARRVVADMVALAHGMGGTCTGAAHAGRTGLQRLCFLTPCHAVVSAQTPLASRAPAFNLARCLRQH